MGLGQLGTLILKRNKEANTNRWLGTIFPPPSVHISVYHGPFKMTETSKDETYQMPETIVLAAKIGRLDLVKGLLEKGEDPNTVDEIGASALHNAAREGHWDVARLLLEKNAAPRLLDGDNRTPLQLAVLGGNGQIVGLLLESDRATGEMTDKARKEDLHRSLRIAALRGHLEIVEVLLSNKAPTLSDTGCETALLLAAKKGHHHICEALMKHDMALNRSLWTRLTGPSLAVDGTDYTGNSPLAYAVKNGFEKTVDSFLRFYPNLCGARDGEKSLLFHKAIRAGNIEMTRVFLNNGADVEMKGSYGRRALHEAVSAASIYGTSSDKTVEMIKLLIDHGASTTSTNSSGGVPELSTQDPKIRTLLRNYTKAQSKGSSVQSEIAQKSSYPPPEYTLKA